MGSMRIDEVMVIRLLMRMESEMIKCKAYYFKEEDY